MGGMLAGALAAVSLGLLAPMPSAGPPAPAPKRPYAKKGRGRSKQKASRDRLTLDRSSNIAKFDRWARNGTLEIAGAGPDQRVLMRHSWYRRQKEKEARAGATEAWQQAAQ